MMDRAFLPYSRDAFFVVRVVIYFVHGKMMKKGLVVMKTKVNHPYIYFLTEPNVVMVYRIATQNYVTEQDVIQPEVCTAYEIVDCTEFNEFNHEQHHPIEGKSFFIGQQELNKIIEEINTQIQNERRTLDLSNHGPVHIVMSESAAGSLRVALLHRKTVIGIPDSFMIGPLRNLHEKVGIAARDEWLYDHINYEQEDGTYRQQFANTMRQIEDLVDDVPIYIWYADNADEQIGVRFILYLLREKTNDMYIINSTEQYEKYCVNKEQPIDYTSQMDSEVLKVLFEKNKETGPLSNEKRIQLETEWQVLSESKDMLRIWLDNEIKGMPEHYFDSFIMQTIEKIHKEQGTTEFINTGFVIGELLEQLNASVNIFFLEYRIRHLIYSGQLELKGIPKSMRHYSVRLR